MTFAEWKIHLDMKGQYALASTDVWDFRKIFEDYPILTGVFVDHLFKQGYVLIDLSKVDSIYPFIVQGHSFAKLSSYWSYSDLQHRAIFNIMDGDTLIAGEHFADGYKSNDLHPDFSTEVSIHQVRQRWMSNMLDKQRQLEGPYNQEWLKVYDQAAFDDYQDRILKIDQFLKHRDKDPNWMTL